jgi:phosphate transport system permease protein
MNRRHADKFFSCLFFTVALVSVFALCAIVLFVFAQGAMPFARATADGVRLVPQRIDYLTVNGAAYSDHSSFINIPKDEKLVSVRFPLADGTEEILEFEFDAQARAAGQAIRWTQNERGVVSESERYVFTVSWQGAFAALDKKIHILLPEPPLNPARFLFGMRWSPANEKLFGILPMIAGTVLVSLGAIALGVPAALLSAMFVAEFSSVKLASVIRGGIELLAGIPSVVFGFFGLMVVVPAVKTIFAVPSGNTMLSASFVLALMLLPTVFTIAETSLRSVPLAVREASLALGASKMQTAWRVVLPHAHSGVAAGIILGISRAVGETMAVILVAGNSPQLIHSPLQSVRTLTATIAMEMGYASGRHSEALFSIGAVLFILILLLNSAMLRVRRGAEAA